MPKTQEEITSSEKSLNLFWRLPIRSLSQNTRAMQGFLHCVWPLGMHVWAIFTPKINDGHKWVENYCIGKKIKLVLKTTYEKLVLLYQSNARFPSLCLASENAFMSYFYSKNGHKSMENHHIRIKVKLVLKTICKKFYLKCQDNAKFLPCVCPVRECIFELFF